MREHAADQQKSAAIVLAAGRGTRFKPLTDTMPKPLVPVAGKPLLDYALDYLHDAGMDRVVVNCSYKAEMLKAHVQQRTQPHIMISHEPTPLETGGGIYYALPLLHNAPFIALNSDIICRDTASSSMQRLMETWQEGLRAVLLVHPVDKAIGYDGRGDFFVSDEGKLRRRQEHETAPYVFAGVQLLHPAIFHDAPATEGDNPPEFSMNLLYNTGMDSNGWLAGIRAVVHDGDWLHVGDMKGLEQAEAYFQAVEAA